ncbi:Titin [Eumeta japonica]|uniref:Titin n=1 Tax=Eumeta variegata TaxID=151549 RepID=A0A4C1TCE4_EUMVA|nr:Titin [Eumeta japonica]
MDEVGELPGGETRRSSSASEGFTRPDPDDEERWKKLPKKKAKSSCCKCRRLPHFIVFLSDRTVEAGKNVRLSCAVGGPELSVKWFKDGRQLERDNTHRIINNNNILALDIINTTILDSGEYQCVIANMNDEVTSSCYVTIYEVFKDEPAPPSFRLVKEYYHLRDDELTIEVHVHGVPRPVVTWWRGAFEIKPNVKFTKLEEAHGVFKLLIYKPNNKDNGVYTCKAINSSGEAQITHAVEVAKNRHFHVHGIFHARDRIQKDKELKAKAAMEDALKSKGESDKRRAERAPRASPEPLVPVKQKLKFATHCVIEWLWKAPRCLQINCQKRCPEIETSCYFKVYAAQAEGDEHEPIFALPLRDVYHSSQNDLILDTKIRGNPRPKITWIKDQLPVVLDDRIVQIEHLDGICELIINKPTANDSGNYTCVAQNKLGTQETSHSVVVDVNQGSRRSSVLSGAMSDSDAGSRRGGAGAGGDKAGRPPKSKKKDDEGDVSYERRSRLPDPSPKQQLYFTTYLSNCYVAVGSKVKLQAVIDGPNPAMKWTKDDQGLQYGPRLRI